MENKKPKSPKDLTPEQKTAQRWAKKVLRLNKKLYLVEKLAERINEAADAGKPISPQQARLWSKQIENILRPNKKPGES